MTTDNYLARGVDSAKKAVHAAIAHLDKGLYPGAFCNILPDIAEDPGMCTLVHTDGVGTKSILPCLMAACDPSLGMEPFEGLAVDAIAMNVNDMACVGATGPYLISNNIGRNTHVVDAEKLAAVIRGFSDAYEMLGRYGISCQNAGGETADLNDIVRTLDINCTAAAWMARNRVIDASRMQPGDIIIGFSSTGQAAWETRPNSGIGSNGFTNARHDMLANRPEYANMYDHRTPEDLVYRGPFNFDDLLPGDPRFTIGQALLSPTRIYVPLIKMLLEHLTPDQVHGIIHCTGGGQTKIGKFGMPGNIYVKDNLFEVPPLFAELRRVSQTSWHDMYKTYNMGHLLEVVVTHEAVDFCIQTAAACGIEAKVVGRVRSGVLMMCAKWRSSLLMASLPTDTDATGQYMPSCFNFG